MAAAAAVLAVALSVGTVSALAADGDAGSRGYLAGQQQSSDRHAKFEQAAGLAEKEDREVFFREAGIGDGGAYSEAPHLDADALAEAGVIDQDTAERIEAYAAQKQTSLHDWYAAKPAGQSPQDRRAYFESRQTDRSGGGSVEELLEAGVITQDQADAINAYLAN